VLALFAADAAKSYGRLRCLRQRIHLYGCGAADIGTLGIAHGTPCTVHRSFVSTAAFFASTALMLACSRGYPVRLSQGDVRGPLTRFLMPVGPYRCGRDAEVDSVGDAGKVTVCTALHGSGPVSAIAVLNRRDTLTALFLHFAGGADSIAQHTTYDSLAAALDAQLGKGTWCGHAQEWWAHQRWWHGAGWSLTLQARGRTPRDVAGHHSRA
jgi:hypothetical protein